MKNKKAIGSSSYSIDNSSARVVVGVTGELRAGNSSNYLRILPQLRSTKGAERVVLDLTSAGDYDSYLAVLVSTISRYCQSEGIAFEFLPKDERMSRFVETLSPPALPPETDSEKRGFIGNWIVNVGETSITFTRDAISFVEFVGDLLIKTLALVGRPTSMRWRDFPFQFLHTGVYALPIVVLIVFLIGLITGYQGALQLQQFGADIYIANLVGISIARELSPLMTAILVAGRSGSAFAAEIGTMKVSEEVDALSSMGYDPIRFLVLPRVFAVMVAMPFLTLIADLAGVVGGLFAAITTLDISITGYMNQLQISLDYYDVFTGIGKSIVFGYLISAIGCFRGLQVRGGAESVGKFTTASVVTGVFLIILTDAVFTFLFQAVGI